MRKRIHSNCPIIRIVATDPNEFKFIPKENYFRIVADFLEVFHSGEIPFLYYIFSKQDNGSQSFIKAHALTSSQTIFLEATETPKEESKNRIIILVELWRQELLQHALDEIFSSREKRTTQNDPSTAEIIWCARILHSLCIKMEIQPHSHVGILKYFLMSHLRKNGPRDNETLPLPIQNITLFQKQDSKPQWIPDTDMATILLDIVELLHVNNFNEAITWPEIKRMAALLPFKSRNQIRITMEVELKEFWRQRVA